MSATGHHQAHHIANFRLEQRACHWRHPADLSLCAVSLIHTEYGDGGLYTRVVGVGHCDSKEDLVAAVMQRCIDYLGYFEPAR
ncbi:hypothetical protein D9M69_688400 [compost metagenome]